MKMGIANRPMLRGAPFCVSSACLWWLSLILTACQDQKGTTCTESTDGEATGTISVTVIQVSQIVDDEADNISDSLIVGIRHHDGSEDPSFNINDSSVQVALGTASLDESVSFDVPTGWTSASASAAANVGTGDSPESVLCTGDSSAICVAETSAVGVVVNFYCTHWSED